MKLQPRRIAEIALCLAVSAQSAHGACLVLKGGASMEVRTAPKAKGAMVVFQDLNGKLASMRGTEVDMAATDDANARGVCGGSVGTPARDTPRPVAIQAPTEPVVSTPSAREILANSPEGAKAGPPAGVTIDCDVVECGKVQEPMPVRRDNAARRPASTDSASSVDERSETSPRPRQQRPPSKDPDKHGAGYGEYDSVPEGGPTNRGEAMRKPPVVKPPVVKSPAKKPPM